MPTQADNLNPSTVTEPLISTVQSEPTPSVIDPSSVSPTPVDAVGGWDMQQLQSLFEAGGPVIMILASMSLVALIVFLAKCGQFFWLSMGRYKTINAALEYWHNKDTRSAHKFLHKTRNPIAKVLATAMHLKQSNTDNAIAREEVTRIAKRELASARSYLKILEVIATLSPLLGLLGTVLGMIVAFQKLQGAGSTIDPSVLSGGIWEALLTTAAGLIVAIPTVVGLNWLEQRVERFKLVMEDTMTQVFTSDVQLAEAIEITRQLNSAHKPIKKSSPASRKDKDAALAT